ncbi:hypothetical protein EMIHUDRAFT_248538 [Emiliania huxleyi CCMP1516]|uniref:Uncharacterized protein n=2 Tax=Emiliania huxleyi TaxID=2903 RepID=A0A0D3IFS5_EMIH1|nr:hypothetical protein EMIHUDRAFT_248538 [Emiliania huxleyi CCMP1516]EOD10110.1 hypothetical protein EMIHUDRAFT_248538 [Emiliania huxleyi CCMP1516]|eukprot:XP_005762539.1 hypothetical protein EMIHUDRAFT_248538 [Emiliania huxleyi CCMP1516]
MRNRPYPVCSGKGSTKVARDIAPTRTYRPAPEMFSSFSPSAEAHRLVFHHPLNLTIRPVEHTASSRRTADCSAGVVHPSIRSNAVEAIGAPQHTVFLHLKLSRPSANGEPSDTLRAARQLSSTAVVRLSRSEDDGRKRGNSTCPRRAGSMWDRFAIMSVDHAVCWSMMVEHEAATSQAFALFVKLRPDLQLCSPLPSWRTLAGARGLLTWATGPDTNNKVHDMLGIMPRSVAALYFNAHPEVEACVPREAYAPFCPPKYMARSGGARADVPPECLLNRFLRRRGVVPNDTLGSQRVCLWLDPSTVRFCDTASARSCAHSWTLRPRILWPRLKSMLELELRHRFPHNFTPS